MDERVVLVRLAIMCSPRVMAGRITETAVSLPPEGSQPSHRENTSMSIMPSQKPGMDIPMSDSTTERLSIIVP